MSSKPIIRIQGLGKKYRIRNAQIGIHRSLGEELAKWLRNPFGQENQLSEFWALEKLDLTIGAGECVGIIGPNGSGKSTLLKILARVVWPTIGRVELDGRVGALLEVGTGFNLELNGRENIYLSGAMLGMKKKEVDTLFDEIVEFSGVEKFIEMPLKRYSSGMFLRLAFSVMAHLKCDILVLDEVLAVGDASFQEKCLKKMQGVLDEGRTVIFVSHQMESVRFLCKRAIWLENGRLIEDGPVARVLENYNAHHHLHSHV